MHLFAVNDFDDGSNAFVDETWPCIMYSCGGSLPRAGTSGLPSFIRCS